MDAMDFEYENLQDWEFFQNRIVFNREQNQKIKEFIENTQRAKVMAERKMRFDLDQKILQLRNERLKQSLGKDFIQRLRHYIKGYYQNVDGYDSISMNESGSILGIDKQPSLSPESPSPSRRTKMQPQMSMIKKGQKVTFKTPSIGISTNNVEEVSFNLLVNRVNNLRRHTKEIEKTLPMYSFQTDDDAS